MTETSDALVLDLVEWVAREPRLYSDVIEAWRTSCPRLTIWEDAVDRGYVARQPVEGLGVRVAITGVQIPSTPLAYKVKVGAGSILLTALQAADLKLSGTAPASVTHGSNYDYGWTIAGNRISATRDSGVITEGRSMLITQNVIAHTGTAGWIPITFAGVAGVFGSWLLLDLARRR